MNGKQAIILINTGSPSSVRKRDVFRYLKAFLNDPSIITIPFLLRLVLVNIIIIPFRLSKSTGLYQRLHQKYGFPLVDFMEKLTVKMSSGQNINNEVYGLMRYGKPSLKEFLQNLNTRKYSSLVFIPLFPQYARATTGSIEIQIRKHLKMSSPMPQVKIIRQFYKHPSFIRLFAQQVKSCKPADFDIVVFSYHSLPVSHITETHPSVGIENCDCRITMPTYGKYCYKATCYETTRLIAMEAGLAEGSFTTSFQSRLSKGWLSPFTDDVILKLAAEGKKRILVAAPSFVADCLETVIEIREDYRKIFREAGGEELVLVDSLNDMDEWVEALFQIAGENEG